MSLITKQFMERYQEGIIPKIRNYVKSKNINEKGTAIESGTNLDDFMTLGVYYIADDTTASSIDNIPLAISGKVLVMDNGNGGFVQLYLPNQTSRMFQRNLWSNGWTDWIEYAPKAYVDNETLRISNSMSELSTKIGNIECKENVSGNYKLTATVDSNGDITYSWNIET